MKNKVLISIIVILCLFLFVFLKDGHTKKAVEQDKKIGNVKVITTTINKENKVKNELVNENTITTTKKITTITTTTVATKKLEKNTTTTKKVQNTTVTTTKVKTVKEENIELINNIEKIYGVKVSYGDGTFCWYDGDSCTILYDDTKANTALKKYLIY